MSKSCCECGQSLRWTKQVLSNPSKIQRRSATCSKASACQGSPSDGRLVSFGAMSAIDPKRPQYRVSEDCRLLNDGEKGPFTGDTLQRVRTLANEPDPRADNQVFDRTGHQDTARRRVAGDARRNMHREPTQVVLAPLAFTGVQPGTRGEAEARQLVYDRL